MIVVGAGGDGLRTAAMTAAVLMINMMMRRRRLGSNRYLLVPELQSLLWDLLVM